MKCPLAGRRPQIESERKAKEATASAQTSLAASRHQPIVVLAQPFGLTFRVLLAAQFPVDLQQKIPGERQARRQGDTLLRLLSRALQSAGLKQQTRLPIVGDRVIGLFANRSEEHTSELQS